MSESEKSEQSGGMGFQPGPGKEHFDKFQGPEWRSELPDIRMQLKEDDPTAAEEEYRSREYLGRDEQYARRDPELQLLMFPKDAKDIDKAIVRVLEKYTDFDKKEANSPYKIQYYMDAADAGAFIFGHSLEDLEKNGYVKGSIVRETEEEGLSKEEKEKKDKERGVGYLEEGGDPKKFGYAMRVDKERREPEVKEAKEKRHRAWTGRTKQTHYIPKFNAEGEVESLQPVQVDVEIEHPKRTEKWEEVSHPIITLEKFYYGTEIERKALQIASKAGHERLVNTARAHTLFSILQDMRADLSGYVTTTCLKVPHISNEQWGQIFNSPDIAKIDSEKPETLENKKYGWRIDKAMRMMDLLAHAETKEKMEDFMNKPTFDKIIDAVKDRALEIMDETGHEDDKAKDMSDEQKVARFLIGRAAVQEENGKWTLGGLKDNDKPRIDRWKTEEERDPSKATPEEIEWWDKEEERDPSKATPEEIEWWDKNDGKYSRGFDEVKYEKKVRGFLTEFGNVYARPEQNLRDKINLMFSKIELLLGDKGAVRDADRYFQITGLRDESNLEVLVKKERMPSVEEIIEAHKLRGEADYYEWRKKAKRWLNWFSLPGDPTGSDLSKIFYPKYFRLKDTLKDRPAGPTLTVYDYDRFAQSMFSLGRSDVVINKEEVVTDGKKEIIQTRSILEQWRGYAKEGEMPQEEATDLGDIDWNAVKVPDKIEGLKVKDEIKELTEEEEKEKIKELLKISEQAIPGSLWSYYTLMNWLAGRDNKIKAPWLFVLDETENLPLLRIASTYTNKEKFLNIVWHGPALAWGEWRSLFIKYKNKKGVMKHLSTKEDKETWKGKRDWYKGVRNLPNFPEIMAQEVKIEDVAKTGTATLEVPVLDRIEGTSEEPGLAIKFGFLTKEELKENETKRLLREQSLR
jgi:hypothetical protein